MHKAFSVLQLIKKKSAKNMNISLASSVVCCIVEYKPPYTPAPPPKKIAWSQSRLVYVDLYNKIVYIYHSMLQILGASPRHSLCDAMGQ